MRAVAATFLVVTSCAAGSGPEPGATTSTIPDAARPALSVELGCGVTAFEPIERDRKELVMGPQGGWHLDMAVRICGVPADGVELSYEVTDTSDGGVLNIPFTSRLTSRSVLPDGDCFIRVGDRAVLDITRASDVVGRRVVVRLRAQAPGADGAEAARELEIVDEE